MPNKKKQSTASRVGADDLNKQVTDGTITVINVAPAERQLTKDELRVKYENLAKSLDVEFSSYEPLIELEVQMAAEQLKHAYTTIIPILLKKFQDYGAIFIAAPASDVPSQRQNSAPPASDTQAANDFVIQAARPSMYVLEDDVADFVKADGKSLLPYMAATGEKMVVSGIIFDCRPSDAQSDLIPRGPREEYDMQIREVLSRNLERLGLKVRGNWCHGKITKEILEPLFTILAYLDTERRPYHTSEEPSPLVDTAVESKGAAKLEDRELMDIEQHWPINFQRSNWSAIYADLFNFSLIDIWDNKDDAKLWKNFIDKRKIYTSQMSVIARRNAEVDKANAEEALFRRTYEKLFGHEKMFAALKDIPRHGIMRSILRRPMAKLAEYISEKERDATFRAIVKRVAQPWDEIVKSLAMRPSDEIMTDLMQYFAAPPPPPPESGAIFDFIRSAAGEPVICLHSWYEYKNILDRRSRRGESQPLRDVLILFAETINGDYYCRTCGELLAEDDKVYVVSFEEGKRVVDEEVEDPLHSFLWRMVSGIFNSYIEYSYPPTRRYINNIVSRVEGALYDIVSEIVKRLSKVKTSTPEEIENKKRVFAAIYAFAFAAKIISDNHERLKFSSHEFKFAPTRADTVYNYVVRKVKDSQGIALSELPEITDDFILQSFIKASEHVSSLFTTTVDDPRKYESDMAEQFIKSATYEYLVMMRYIFEGGSLNEIADPDRLFGVPITSANLSNVTYYPEKYADKLREMIERPKLESADIDKLQMLVMICSYLRDVDEVRSGLDDMVRYTAIVEHGEDEDDVVTLRTDPAYLELRKKWDFVEKGGELYKQLAHLRGRRKYTPLPRVRPMDFDSHAARDNKLLGLIYGRKPNFHKHKWVVPMYVERADFAGYGAKNYTAKSRGGPANGADERRRGGDDAITDKFAETRVMIDQKCSVCGSIYSQAEGDEEILADREEIIGFYNYFDNRCPESLFHEYVDDTCKHCKMSRDMWLNKDDKYFEKYRKVFDEREKDVSSVGFDTKLVRAPPKSWPELPKPRALDVPIIEYLNAIDTSNKSNLALKRPEIEKLFLNIGLFEGEQFDLVLSGKNNIDALDNHATAYMRERKLASYCEYLIELYEGMRNYMKLPKAPEIIAKMAKTANLAQLPPMSELMGMKFLKMYQSAQHHFAEDPAKLAEFVNDYLFTAAFKIYNALTKGLGAADAQIFADEFLNMVLRGESVTSKNATVGRDALQHIDVNEANVAENDEINVNGQDIYEGMDYNGENETDNDN